MSGRRLELDSLPDNALLLILSLVPLENKHRIVDSPELPEMTNRHCLPLVCRRWRDLLASPAAAALCWHSLGVATVPRSLPDHEAIVAGMYRWMRRHAGSLRRLDLMLGDGATPDAHGLLGLVGARLRELVVTAEPWERSTAFSLLALAPRLTSLDLAMDLGRDQLAALDLPPTLRSLTLTAESVETLPRCLTRLADLASLTVETASFSPETVLPTALTQLHLRMRYGARLPAAISALTRLQQLAVPHWSVDEEEGDKDWTALAPSLAARLRHLDLSGSLGAAIPAEVAALTALTHLVLNDNRRLDGEGASLAALSALRSLVCLEARQCSLSSVPDAVTALTSLRTMFICHRRHGHVEQARDLEAIPAGPYLANLESLGMLSAKTSAANFAAHLAGPLRAATALTALRLGLGWTPALMRARVGALIENKPRLQRVEYLVYYHARPLNLAALLRRHPDVVFEAVR